MFPVSLGEYHSISLGLLYVANSFSSYTYGHAQGNGNDYIVLPYGNA